MLLESQESIEGFPQPRLLLLLAGELAVQLLPAASVTGSAAVAAACAKGTSVFEGIGELQVKESDRLAAMASGLKECGVETEATQDTLTVHGTGAAPQGGVTIASRLDHRIAMSYLVLGMASQKTITVDDGGPIETSFPGFLDLMNGLGADMEEAKQ